MKKKQNKLYEALREGLEEILAHKRGLLILESEVLEISESLVGVNQKILKIRKSTDYS